MAMNFSPMRVTIRELYDGFVDSAEQGVLGYGGRLNIRPPYQREFVYDAEKQRKVIETVLAGYPLNAIYWFKVADNKWEVIDGQQRILSICNFLQGSVQLKDGRMVSGIKESSPEVYQTILDTELMVYECGGTQQDRLEWFKAVNVEGTVLTEQEMRNAVYTGPWIADARRYFGTADCSGQKLLKDIVRLGKDDVIRQKLLETVIAWHSAQECPRDRYHIEHYMGIHQSDANAERLFQYAQEVVGWVNRQFPASVRDYSVFHKVPWGILYNKFSSVSYTPSEIESKLHVLFADTEVENTVGIFSYIFSGDPRDLCIRAFPEQMRIQMYRAQGGICPMCRNEGNMHVYKIGEMDADHIKPWADGGKTEVSNGQMLCHKHNLHKSAKPLLEDTGD